MAINFPTLTEVINKARTGIKNALPESNPFLKNSFLDAISRCFGGRVYDVYYNLDKNIIPELFLTTAQDSDSIEDLVVPFSLTLIAGTTSVGILIGTGVLGNTVSSGVTFQDSAGNLFTSTSNATIISSSISVTSLTQVAGVATAVAADHGFFSGLSVTISGANETEYNGTFTVIVVDKDTFTFSVDIGASSPATGTILATATIVAVPVESNEIGSDQNLLGGADLTITTSISGIDDTFYVEFPSLTGGSDLESYESLRQRGLDRYRNPSGHFTPGDIEAAVKEDQANTRVFVEDITPDVGQVTVYFVRDNDGTGTSILPDAAEIAEARDRIEAIAPAVLDTTNDLFVAAPTPVIVNFTFSSITPNTPEMQTAIQQSLTVFFEDVVTVGENVTELEYNSAIINTVDAGGIKLQAFTLTNPSGDVTISSGEIGILGSVTF